MGARKSSKKGRGRGGRQVTPRRRGRRAGNTSRSTGGVIRGRSTGLTKDIAGEELADGGVAGVNSEENPRGDVDPKFVFDEVLDSHHFTGSDGKLGQCGFKHSFLAH